MFIPNTKCTLRRKTGHDVYSKPVFGPEEKLLCGVLRLENIAAPTSVRTDSSASRGFARETTVIARILFLAVVRPKPGDIVQLESIKMSVQSIWPRYNLSGKLDHWQVDLEIAEIS